jgi:hypothetical protein
VIICGVLALLLPLFWNGAQDLLELAFGYGSMDWSKATLVGKRVVSEIGYAEEPTPSPQCMIGKNAYSCTVP